MLVLHPTNTWGIKECQIFKPPGNHLNQRVWDLQKWGGWDLTMMAMFLFVYIFEIKSSDQWLRTDSCYMKNTILFAHPGSHKLCASHPSNTCTAVCHSVSSHCLAKSWNLPKWTVTYHPSLLLGSHKPIIVSRVPKQLHQIDSACSILVQMGRLLPNPPSSQNLQCIVFYKVWCQYKSLALINYLTILPWIPIYLFTLFFPWFFFF